MAPLKQKSRSDRNDGDLTNSPCKSLKFRLLSLLVLIIGPPFLLYLVLRCVKNQCVLFQLPLVVPTHLNAYFSSYAALLVFGFIMIMLLISFTSRPAYLKDMKGFDQPQASTAFASLVCATMIMLILAYLKPEYIRFLYEEYLRMFATTTAFCIGFSFFVFTLNFIGVLEKDRAFCYPMAFLYGYNTNVNINHVELKYFFYVHVGMVAWALLDLIIFLDAYLNQPFSYSATFLAFTQYVFIAHTLLYESYLRKRPFVYTEGLGFLWLMQVLMYLPFLHSLPVYYVATMESSLSWQAILADTVLFIFGFVINISSIHQKEKFLSDHQSYRNLKSIPGPAHSGKRLLVSGYWGVIQKPDYLGYMIIWLSWTIACGYSLLAIAVLLVVYATMFMWLKKSAQYKLEVYGPAWQKYVTFVPYQVIPYLF
ncbi:delta(14)-sterol reductase LBR-like [Physella acuta]|uniref:delta(14)-sterol reductase LBR-like n=1 Tax=Physella acuta TaxID=109671 RepID=UPI0027DB83E5|nr:delta(14)-sterol reductase LBR-like [Physella acuta]